MPFWPPFKHSFEHGDLVYGLRNPRQYHAQKTLEIEVATDFWAIDQFAATLSEREKQVADKKIPPPRQDDFSQFLNATSKYRALISAVGYNGSENRADLRKKSKAGIMWAVEAGYTIHFILDELKINQVINKNHLLDKSSLRSNEKRRSITGAELRWIYRNSWKPSVRQHVQFWLGGKPVLPPWSLSAEQSGLWAAYKDR